MQLYESRLSYFNDKGRINYCKPPSVYQHGGHSRPRQNCHACIFETKENSNLRIRIQYSGHHSKTTYANNQPNRCGADDVRPKCKFYRTSLLKGSNLLLIHNRQFESYFSHTNASNSWRPLQSLLLRYTPENA